MYMGGVSKMRVHSTQGIIATWPKGEDTVMRKKTHQHADMAVSGSGRLSVIHINVTK